MKNWLNSIKDGIIITTADNKQYTPFYINASFVTEYNYTEFIFIDVPGSYVVRKKPMGVKYSLELHFQGIDHLDVANNFKKSIDSNEGPASIQHPLYGDLLVQFTSLGFDDTALNRTKITGTVIETIGDMPVGNIQNLTSLIPQYYDQTIAASEITANTYPFVPADVNTMAANNKSAYNKGLKIIQNPIDFEEYYNAFNTASTYINTATATPILAMRSLTNVVTMPGKFVAQVEQRVKVLIETFNTFRANLFGLIAVSSKTIFCATEANVIASICQAAATPLESDYKLNTEVYNTIDSLSRTYQQFLEDLDYLQANNGGGPLNFVPNSSVMTNLNQLVNITISNLFNIALNARSERYIVVYKDTNVINLTHQLYGLDADDANLDELIANNNLAVWELIQIEKGRKIIYFN